MSRILVVDDDVTLLRTLVLDLRTRRYDVDAVTTGQEALTAAEQTAPDLAIVDLGLPDMDGLEVDASAPKHFITVPGSGYRFER